MARIFGFPLRVGISLSSSATIFHTFAPLTAIFPIFAFEVVTLLVVVELLSQFKNELNILPGLVFTNSSILRFTGVPAVQTIAPDTRIGRCAKSTTAVGEQSPPVAQLISDIFASVQADCPTKAVLSFWIDGILYV